MEPIRILSPNFEIKAEIDNYESLQFSRSWSGVGDFEMHINLYKKDTQELQKNRFFVLSTNKVGIIKHRGIALNEQGKVSENWIVKGYQLKGLASGRITVPPSNTAYDYKSGNAETVMKHYIDKHLVNPVDTDRKIPNLVIAPNQNRGSFISWQSRYKVVADELENISLATGLGWDIYLDYENKQLVFDVFEGKNLTANQSVNPPVIFSPEFESVQAQSFIDSDINMRNIGYIGGQGEGVEREVIKIGSSKGLERIETFIDARDVEATTDLIARGNQKMKELENELFLESEILTTSPFKYGTDYNLGDMTTLQNRKWNVTVDVPVTEIKEIYEIGGYQLEATFGQKRPTLISQLKSKFEQYDNIIKR